MIFHFSPSLLYFQEPFPYKPFSLYENSCAVPSVQLPLLLYVYRIKSGKNLLLISANVSVYKYSNSKNPMIFTAAFLSFPYISSFSFFEMRAALQSTPPHRVYLSGEWIEYITVRYFMSSASTHFFHFFCLFLRFFMSFCVFIF